MEVPEIFVHTLTVYGRRVQEFWDIQNSESYKYVSIYDLKDVCIQVILNKCLNNSNKEPCFITVANVPSSFDMFGTVSLV